MAKHIIEIDLDTLDPKTANPMDCIMALASRLGVRNLAKTYAGKLWEHKVDEQWLFAINANTEPVKTASGVEVEPFHVYVEYNGWPAAILTVRGEGTFAAGTAANVDTFNAAVIAAARGARV